MFGRPKIRESLVIASHEKEGRRFITVLDPQTLSITLLMPWEHAVLLLCDGTRSLFEISQQLENHETSKTGGMSVAQIERTLKLFKNQDLIEEIRPRGRQALPRTRTVAELQQAYLEWHKDSGPREKLLSGIFSAPFTEPAEGNVFIPKGRGVTVAHTGKDDSPFDVPKEMGIPAPRSYDDLNPSELETHQLGFDDPLGFGDPLASGNIAEAYDKAEAPYRPTVPMTRAESEPLIEEVDSLDDPPSYDRDYDREYDRDYGVGFDGPTPPYSEAPKLDAPVFDDPIFDDPLFKSGVSEPSPQTVAGKSLLGGEVTPASMAKIPLREALQDAIGEGPVPSAEEFEEPTAEYSAFQHGAISKAPKPPQLLDNPPVQASIPITKMPPNEETIRLRVQDDLPTGKRRAPPRGEATMIVPRKAKRPSSSEEAESARRRRRRRAPDEE